MPANQLIQTTAPVLLLEREAELAVLEAMLGAAQSIDRTAGSIHATLRALTDTNGKAG